MITDTESRGDKIDDLSDYWFEHYPNIKTGPWQVWGRMCRIVDRFLSEAGTSLKPCDLSYNEFQTLAALILYREQTGPKQIAAFSMLTSGGMTKILLGLESKGLIIRTKNTKDKRGVVVELTTEGRDKFQDALALENKVEHHMLSSLNSKERQQLAKLLRKITLSFGI